MVATPARTGWATAAAVLYALWGVLHVGLGVTMVAGGLSAGLPDEETAAESLMFFLCAIVFGAQAVVVAVTLNRVNDRVGHWLNLTVLGAVDLAFLVVLVLPGHVDLAGGLSGPLLWLLAAICSTLAMRAGTPRGNGRVFP
ncbi:hypothetical protein [Prauserella sp. PE36]|nr:hypothetical protein [Prauserella sp. PE36]